MFAILIRAKMVGTVFQLTHPMTANARWVGLDHTVKVSGRNKCHMILCDNIISHVLNEQKTGYESL